VEEVEKLLQRPEDLERLDTMLEEYTQKHQARLRGIILSPHLANLCKHGVYSVSLQANKAQLSATVATQVEAARAGMALLDKAHRTLANMQNSYKVSLLPCKRSFSSDTQLLTITKYYCLQQPVCKAPCCR
jgi:hypothetical protein